MEEKERNDRLQEIQQRTQPSDQPHSSSPSDSSELVSKSVGPFCLRQRGPTLKPEGNFFHIIFINLQSYNPILKMG